VLKTLLTANQPTNVLWPYLLHMLLGGITCWRHTSIRTTLTSAEKTNGKPNNKEETIRIVSSVLLGLYLYISDTHGSPFLAFLL